MNTILKVKKMAHQHLYQLFSLKKHTLTLFAIFIFSRITAATFFVTPTGAGIQDGSDWTNAAPGITLQIVIDGAAANDEVWVACGTYYPTATTNRSISFAMRNGITIYGGFTGSETLLSDRDLACGPCSILSGEIGAAGNTDNSYKVVYNESLDNTAILDGFTIRDGNDDRTPTSSGNGLGGGLYNHGFNPGAFCHPIIRNCVFTNNFASWGGGAFNNGYNNGNTQPTYINCIFYQNHAYIEAGGMDSYGVGGNASPTVMNTLFYENTAATNVGAMYAWGGNSGGNSAPVLINCIFANNSALNGYAGAFISDNLDENGVTSSGSCTVTLQNCIVWNNTSTSGPDQFYIRGSGAQVVATYSDIDLTNQSSPHTISGAGTGNLSQSPLFMDISDADGPDNCWLTNDDGLQLQSGSPCVDGGDNMGTYATDITGNTRIISTTVDMGLYEFQPPLSMELLSFTASQEKDFVRLEWLSFVRDEEVDFEVERSKDGSSFNQFQIINGNSQGKMVNVYHFVDENPFEGISYYRLKLIDAAGMTTYSNLVSIAFKSLESLTVYPNPASDWLFIQGAVSSMNDFSILNISGQKVAGRERIVQISPQSYKVNIESMPGGLYLIKMGGKVYKIVKEK